MRYYDPGFNDGAAEMGSPFGRVRGTVTLRIVGVTVALYLLLFIIYLAGGAAFDAVTGALALTPSRVFGSAFVWQLLTFGFLHHPAAVLEILFNLIFFCWMGLAVEALWGGRRFLVFCLTGTIFTGLCYCAASYLLRPTAGVMGMSGMLMATLAVYTLWWPKRTVYFFFVIPMRIWQLTALIVLISVLTTLAAHRGDLAGGVTALAYLGGLLFGWLAVRAERWRERLGELRDRAQSQLRRQDEQRLDEVLDKVHREGMNSLSWGERRFLKRYSREKR
jgi:membrane associated rhomboid family serine protease